MKKYTLLFALFALMSCTDDKLFEENDNTTGVKRGHGDGRVEFALSTAAPATRALGQDADSTAMYADTVGAPQLQEELTLSTHIGKIEAPKASKDSPATRADVTDDLNILKFGIFGYSHGGAWTPAATAADYFLNKGVVLNGGGDWVYDGVLKYWPKDSRILSFFAYSPHNDVIDPTYVISPASTLGGPAITYTAPKFMGDQKDIVYAVQKDMTYASSNDGMVGLTFNHALTMIGFQARLNPIDEGLGYTIDLNQISLTGIVSTGTFNLNAGTWNVSRPGTNDGFTSYDLYNIKDYPQGGLTLETLDTDGDPSNFSYQSVTQPGQYLMLPPQLLGDGTDGLSKAQLTVVYTLTDKQSGTTKPRTVTFDLATTTQWTTGKYINYQLTLSTLDAPGPLAAPGQIGYIRGTNKLTIRGSKEYKNTSLIGPDGNALATGEPLEDATVYAAYFKWGSLVAIGSEGGNGDEFGKEDIIAGPHESGYDVARLKNTTIGSQTGATAWAQVPNRTGADAQTNAWKADYVNGLGDPCDYYFGDRKGGSWKMPSGAPWGNEIGSPFGTAGSDVANWTGSGLKGPGAKYVDISDPAYAAFPVNGAVGGDGSGGQDWSVFLPATGIRSNPTGTISVAFERGYDWSNRPGNTGYYVGFSPTTLRTSSETTAFENGIAVRCVRAAQGPLAAPGQIGYIKGTNKLTIRGSKEYKGTAVMENNGAGPNALATGMPLEDATVYVAYFKWGSLVAIGSEGGNGDEFGKEDIIAGPHESGYDVARLKNTIIGSKTGANAWGSDGAKTIPYRDASNDGTSLAWAADYANGLGDPCDYYFGDRKGGSWRLPTGGDPWGNEVGNPFGNQNVIPAAWPLSNGADWIETTDVTPNMPVNGAVGGNGSGKNWSMFMATTGVRDPDNGSVRAQGITTSSWSNATAMDGTAKGKLLLAYKTGGGVYALGADRFSFGFGIRCVRPAPGPLAAPGQIGYIKGTNKLTIRGSKEYAGTPVMNGSVALATGEPLENATVYAAYFKWGSLVALGSEGGNGDRFGKEDVVAGPHESGYDVANLKNNMIGTLSGITAYNLVPGRSGADVRTNAWKADPANGLGDPCDYYFGDRKGGDWKLPTGAPWFNEGGTPFGNTALTTSGWTITSGLGSGAGWVTKGTSGLPNAGAVGGSNGAKDWRMFLPGAGLRGETTGGVGNIDVIVSYWSSTPHPFDAGYPGWDMFAQSTELRPSDHASPTDRALPIRCVRPAPGPLAAPGVIGYIKGTNKLTIRGSMEYAGTPVVQNGIALATGQPLENETVYAAYFKWGSLIALGSEGGNYNTFGSEDIVAGPHESGYDVANLKNNTIGTVRGGNAYSLVPYRTGADARTNRWKAEPAKGLGDPCDYYFGDRKGGDWKLPTGGNNTSGGWSGGDGAWYNEGGYPFGITNVSEGWTTGEGGLGNGAAYMAINTNGLPIGGVVGGNGGGGKDWSMYLPGAGLRNDANGMVSDATYSTSMGYYWSSTPVADGTTAYSMTFAPTQLTPLHNASTFERAQTIRCVRPKASGPLAAPGQIGYIKGTDILTLRGSKEYRGTPVAPSGIALATGEPVSTETVYVAYFKWGSLIAIGSEGGEGDVFTKFDVITGPKGYNLSALKNTTIGNKVGADAWSAVPYNPGTTWTANIASAYGDPCDYYFGDGDGNAATGTSWKLPTGGNPGWYNEGGSPFGNVSYSDGWTTGSGGKGNGAAYIAVNTNGMPIAGVVGGDGSGGKDWSMFLPEAGLRVDGRAGNYIWSYYWSSTLFANVRGYSMYFGSNSILAPYHDASNFERGQNIRCVRP